MRGGFGNKVNCNISFRRANPPMIVAWVFEDGEVGAAEQGSTSVRNIRHFLMAQWWEGEKSGMIL